MHLFNKDQDCWRLLGISLLSLLGTVLVQSAIQAQAPMTPKKTGMRLIGKQTTAAPQSLRRQIPRRAAISVVFCAPVKFDAKQAASFPVTVVLARPITDRSGTVLAPANSMASVQLKPHKSKGIQISAEALVINGQYIPIQTAALAVPVLSSTNQDGYYSYDEDRYGMAFSVANGLQDWLGDQGILDDSASDWLGAGLAIASGVSRSLNKPKVKTTMEIPQGSTFVLPLLAAVDLPGTPVPLSSTTVETTPCSNEPATQPSNSESNSKQDYEEDEIGEDGIGEDEQEDYIE